MTNENEKIERWLTDNCRFTNGDHVVWPRGTRYSMAQSKKIVALYFGLGLEPDEAVTVDVMTMILQRIEGLERLFATLGPVAHFHPGETRHTIHHEPVNADVIREGISGRRVATAEDQNDLQTYLEGDRETAEAAARRLDQRMVNTGRMSPAAFKTVHGELPDRTPEGHAVWCGCKAYDKGNCQSWGMV